MLTDEERKLVEIVKGYLPCYEDEEDDHWILSMAKDLIKAQSSQSDEVLVERMASLLAMRFVYGRDSEFNPLNYTGLSETEKQVALKDAWSLLTEIKPTIYLEGVKAGREEVIKELADIGVTCSDINMKSYIVGILMTLKEAK